MKPFKFTNDGDGFQMLHSCLTKLSYEDNNIIISLESTAHYGDNLVRYLVAYNYDVFIIAKTLMMQDSYRFVSFYDLDLMNLKQLGRFRQKTIKQRTRLKIQLTSYVNQTFPKLQYSSGPVCIRKLFMDF